MNYKRDYYKILGLKEDSDKTTIKKAYKKLAIKYHPDINKSEDAEKKFKLINEAYAVLSDDEKRRKYDSYRFKLKENHNKTIVKKKTSIRKSKRKYKKRKNNISKYINLAASLEKDYGLISGLIGLKTKSGNGKHRHRHGKKGF